MIPYGQMKNILQAQMKDTSTEMAGDILLYTNEAIRDIASDHFFDTLRREIAFTTLLPADMERPYYVQLTDTDFIAFPISDSSRYTSQKLYNWWMNRVTTEPLSIGSDGVIAANGTAFTSASPSVAFAASMIGEYIQIGENEGIYKITAVPSTTSLTLADGFRGDAETAAHYEVRPQFTQQMAVTDYEGNTIDEDVSTFIYQQIPLPIYNDYDPIPLPGNCKAVRIMVQQMLMLGEKYDNDALKRQPDFQSALDKMKPLQPTRGRTPAPRNRNGSRILFGRNQTGLNVDKNSRRILGI